MVLGNEIIESFVYCKYKSYQKLHGKEGVKTDYELVQNKLYELYKQRYIENLKLSCNNTQIERTFPMDIKLQGNTTIIINPEVNSDGFSITLDAIEIAKTKKSRKRVKNIPIMITSKERISKEDKILLTIKAMLLNRILNQLTETGKIIYGKELKSTFIKTKDYKRHAQKALDGLLQLSNGNNKPVIIRNDNCQICEFEESCKKHLVEKDDLSLLSSFSLKEIIKRNKKGIFTINQLSYNFRPKRFKKIKEKGCPFSCELKALAIREKKTYVLDTPIESKAGKDNIYIDFEGLPDEDFVYLIGIVIKSNGSEEIYSFWADSKEQEKEIFQKLIGIISRYQDYAIYHYGSYEAKELRRASKAYPELESLITTNILQKSVNLLSLFYSKIYTPTYTNGLKDIARFLGFKWSAVNSTGIQSIAWRKNWELFNEDKHKDMLLRYNIEDCQALIIIAAYIEKLRHEINSGLDNKVGYVSDIKNQSTYKFGKTEFLLPDLEVINTCSYFNYQREKVFLKTNFKINKIVKKKRKIRQAKRSIKINSFIRIPFPEQCPNCGNSAYYKHNRQKRVIIDLKFTIDGTKKWVTQYDTSRFRCLGCNKVFTPDKFKSLNYKYGRSIFMWAINQHISYGISFRNIEKMLLESFNIKFGARHLQDRQTTFAHEYKDTYKEILDNISKGHLLHADETQVNIRKVDSSGYVWVFTNMESVCYLFKPNRAIGFVKELFKNFRGVLVSDFYAGYDSIACSQQKCLIHFIRDLNEDLLKNPFDIEFKHIVTCFGKLLRPIVDAAERHGLKRRNFSRHKKSVEKFFDQILNVNFSSETALQYQKRIKKNKDKLFTFMNYDGIPWNNNNAEHAIKQFAMHRRNMDGLFSAKSIEDFLILLSICQTCKYMGLSFLHFLLSGKKSIFKYFDKQYRLKGTAP